MIRSPAPFSDRLALARRLVARGPIMLAPHVTDQLDAADREAKQIHGRLPRTASPGAGAELAPPYRPRSGRRHQGAVAGRAPRLHQRLRAPSAWRTSACVRTAATASSGLCALLPNDQSPHG